MGSDRRIIDVDAHYFEPIRKLADYLDPPWSDRIADHGHGSLLPGSTGDRFMAGRFARNGISYPQEDMEPEDVPAVMEIVGVDACLLFPNKMLGFANVRGEDERMVVLANAYTDYMLDEVVEPDAGIYTYIVAPYADPEATADLVDRVGDEPGVVGVYLITAGPEPPLGHRRYDPIYEAAERASLPVIYHAGGASLDHFHVRGYEKFVETHTLGLLWSNLAQITSITIQGVPEKFPDLDIVFMESGVLWVPMIMYRLDAEYMKRQSEAPLLDRRPSSYMREYYYGTQPLEVPEDLTYLEHAMRQVGIDQFMYASDYPHWDYDKPSVVDDLTFLSEDEKRWVLSGTASKVFGI